MKILSACLIVLLVVFPVVLHAEGSVCDRAVINEFIRMYQLDTTNTKIEVLTNHLKSADIGEGEISIRPLTQKEPLGLFTVIANVHKAGKVVESGQVRFNIRKYADVLVTTDRIRRHDTFSEQNVAIRRMEVTSLREKPLTDLGALKNMHCKRNLRKGMILVSGAVEPIPDMDAGREVTIMYIDGLCQISTPGIVLQPGMAGDYVRVKNKSSSKVILARIVDNNVVAVDP